MLPPRAPEKPSFSDALVYGNLSGMDHVAGAVAKDVARQIAYNVAMSVPPIRQWRLNRRPRAGAAFTGDPQLLDRYAFQALRGIERYAGSIRGHTVIEFGPGDTLSAGLAVLAAGAERYVALDRFVPDYSRRAAKRWYEGVRAAWPSAFPDRAWPEYLEARRFPEGYADRVGHLTGSVEQVTVDEQFDIVSSWQVGEHVLDVSAFAFLTARLLKPDGIAIHRVDFGPHDCWRDYRDPLTFLRLPGPIWTAMGRSRGLPNRVRHHEFLEALQAAGLTVRCHDVSTFATSGIEFARLRPQYREIPRESLLVQDVVYVCQCQ